MVVDSSQKMLSVQELIEAAAENANEQAPYELVLAAFVKETQMPDSKFLRYGNTLFIIHGTPSNPRFGQFRALNADTPQNYLRSSYQFVVDAYKAGYDVLVTQFKDQSLVNLFRNISQRPPQEGMGYEVKQSEDGEYVVTLKLGIERGGEGGM
jgi:hypothetical protein